MGSTVLVDANNMPRLTGTGRPARADYEQPAPANRTDGSPPANKGTDLPSVAGGEAPEERVQSGEA